MNPPKQPTIIVIESAETGQIIASQLLQKETVLGFDTESTVPNAVLGDGRPPDVSLIQLANSETVWLFRVGIIGMPPALKKVLTTETIVKIGVGLGNDDLRLHRMFSFHLRGVIDLSMIALTLGWAGTSLEEICQQTQLPCDKTKHLGNWDVPSLSPQQITYAANDALLSYYAYYRMIPRSTPSLPTRAIPGKQLDGPTENDIRIAMAWVIEQLHNSPNPRTVESLTNQMVNSYGPWRRRWITPDRRRFVTELLDTMIKEKQVMFDNVNMTLFFEHHLKETPSLEVADQVPEYFAEEIGRLMLPRLAGLPLKSAVNLMVNGYGGWCKYPKPDRERWATQVYQTLLTANTP